MITSHQLEYLGIDPREYNELSQEEKDVLNQILDDMSENDNSDLYEALYNADYEEIPVDFMTFISDDKYLGRSTRNGNFLYPFWRKEGQKIMSLSDICEVALSGSIGIGKTTAGVLFVAYHLYKTMCMRDPQAFFSLAPGSEITYAFLNNTLSSSYGVAYKTFQAFIQESPWFLKHGKISGRTEPMYYPEKGFGFIVGSRPQHTLGKHIICLSGDTEIFTTDGVRKIEDLVDKKIRVISYDEENDKVIISKDCTVEITDEVSELIEITLEDDTVIKCTPFHRLMLKDGTYKMAKDLTEEDELMDINTREQRSRDL